MSKLIYYDGSNFTEIAKLEHESDPKLGADLDGNVKKILQSIFKNYGETFVFHSTFTGTETIDIEDGNVHEINLTGNVTNLTFNTTSIQINNVCSFTLIVVQDSTLRTIQWPATIIWNNDTIPQLDTEDFIYMIMFMSLDAGTTWYGFYCGEFDNS